jgi:hypothetical protein
MKMELRDSRTLRLPLVVLGLLVFFLVLLVGFGWQQKISTELALQLKQKLLNQAIQRYQSSGQEKDKIVQYLPIYQRLIETGFIGEEKRMEWVDYLRTIQQENKLFDIKYTLAAQETYKPTFNLNPGLWALHRSVMKLELAMLHEGDLMLLMDELSARNTTPFILRQCELIKQPDTTFVQFGPNMQASCELDWITVREPQDSAVGRP